MNNVPNREMIKYLKTQFPKGSRVELVSMNDPYNTKLKPGDRGTVAFVDDLGDVFVDWDCGSSLGVVLGVDCITRL